MVWNVRTGFEGWTEAAAELPRGLFPSSGAVRADASGLSAADGRKLPWDDVERVAMKRNVFGLPHLLVRLRDGGRARIGVPLGVPLRLVDELVEIVDSHYRPAR
jgi:hypothetical protein